MKTITFLLHNNFEQAEYEEFDNQLKSRGYTTLLITTNNEKEVQVLQNDVNKGDTLVADIFAKEAKSAGYDALVLPSGAVNADTIRGNEEAHNIITAIYKTDKPHAAICHDRWVLINTGIAKNKKLTAYYTLKLDLENAGAEFVDESVQVDGNLITSRNPDNINNFVAAIDKALA